MGVLQRVSKLLKANVDQLLDAAEQPDAMLRKILREMDDSIVELRREVVGAEACQKRIEKQIEESRELSVEREKKAALELDHRNRDLARRMLGERVSALHERRALEVELESATDFAQRLKSDLVRMEQQVEVARRRQADRIRRRRQAEAERRETGKVRRSAKPEDRTGAAIPLEGAAAAQGLTYGPP